MKLYEKLLEIQKEIIGLAKDGAGYGYKYVTSTKVMDHIKPLMNKHGLLLKQEIIEIEHNRIDYDVKIDPATRVGVPKSEMFFIVKLKFTWVDAETGETDVNFFSSAGMNEWEKGLGSALTYGERYFLLKYFHIATDEDDIDNHERKEEEKKILEETEAKFKNDVADATKNLNAAKTVAELATTYGKLSPETKKAVLQLKNDLKDKLGK